MIIDDDDHLNVQELILTVGLAMGSDSLSASVAAQIGECVNCVLAHRSTMHAPTCCMLELLE